MEALQLCEYALWFHLIQIDDVEGIDEKIGAYVKVQPQLAHVKDKDGRVAADSASMKNKKIINASYLWFGRYKLIELRPEHQSATCYVYKALDEGSLDEHGNPQRVALKFMRVKKQFLLELSARLKGFDPEYIVEVLRTHPTVADSNDPDCLADWPEVISDVSESGATDDGEQRSVGVPLPLNKASAEKMFCLVMPLADRNMFVSLKQERYAGRDMEQVRHVFLQLVRAVHHLHEKGILHGDIKPLNLVRVDAQWKLIDLDASCVIGEQTVGSKSSSAYICPEGLYADTIREAVVVRSEANQFQKGARFELLVAHPSFDVWSLGCVLYQLCNSDVRPLFQGGQDDNLSADMRDDDNLWMLAAWQDSLKSKKLAKVVDANARNLLSQMLSRDPLKRPSLARIIAHPFLSKKSVTRMNGEPATYDVFLSYRVASDAHHTELLYKMLTDRGLKVWWDKVCLPPGKNWEEGFCAGLVSSRALVCILSKGGINHPEKPWQNFANLTKDSNYCDNVFLEHRLGIELRNMGFLNFIFPVMIGDYDENTSTYSNFFACGGPPKVTNDHVPYIESILLSHMDHQALGTPLEPGKSVSAVLTDILKCQGALITGDGNDAFNKAADTILRMLQGTDQKESSDVHGELKVASNVIPNDDIAGPGGDQLRALVAARAKIQEYENEIAILKAQLAERSK